MIFIWWSMMYKRKFSLCGSTIIPTLYDEHIGNNSVFCHFYLNNSCYYNAHTQTHVSNALHPEHYIKSTQIYPSNFGPLVPKFLPYSHFMNGIQIALISNRSLILILITFSKYFMCHSKGIYWLQYGLEWLWL